MLVISAKSGQLGNRLLLFANFIAFALENKLTVLNPAFEEYAEYFQSTARDVLCCYPIPPISIRSSKLLRKYYYNLNRYLAQSGRFNTIELKRDKPFNWSNSNIVEQLKPGTINFFQGWLFRDGWFADETPNLRKHSQAIRSYFQPLNQYQENVAKLISSIRRETDVLIGVHIRHGDYQQHQNGRYFYQIEQYVKVMESAQALFPSKKVTFLICSNAKQEPQQFQHLSYVFANNHIIEDMYSLAECDYIIGPPSSYTMWASFYGERPLYMIRDVNKTLEITDFVHFYQWQGVFHYDDDWSKSFWEWTH
ncbi:alpha-1,2-fucosyltransferase [Iningainema tapete]|uniref:Alpha-1,2-fucosyltransferase n=1 Tax=Iningainema tapete BLCC-T55 TaxID=2748662 RepID=A0A8J6XK77_9CYAN|nr:alpha-1,2-fucosyltransferase [Iningainema tapete]MBD2778430.1 alpha-1,2-fucosyltransferase [Iningainema tapete BLCC-T55]